MAVFMRDIHSAVAPDSVSAAMAFTPMRLPQWMADIAMAWSMRV